MLFWFLIFAIAFFLLTPSTWMAPKQTKGWIVGKLALTLFFGYMYGYIDLTDHTFSAVIVVTPFWYACVLVGDIFFVATKMDAKRKSVDKEIEKIKRKSQRVIITFSLLGAFLILVWLFMTAIYPMFVKKDLYNLVNAQTTDQSVEAMDIDHIPTVPLVSAIYKAEKLIGSLPNSSYYKIGEPSRQKINGEEYWVAPIQYSGFWTSRKVDGIPGYIKISAERKDDSGELVQDYKMKYTPSSFFGKDLMRHVREAYPDKIIRHSGFEPDENGKPYYVVSIGSYIKFRSGYKIEKAVLVDPQSGEMKSYELDDVPDFVDFVVPDSVASTYNDYEALYKHGFWNRYFGKKDKSTVTKWDSGEEVLGVYGTDGHMYWFTDHSSPGTNSLKGYSLMDGRTGKFVFYSGVKGFTNGKAALDAVHNTYKMDQWVGTNPILYNIYGEETWYISVVDTTGLLRNIALVNAKNSQIVATGETKQEALTEYKFKLATEAQRDNVNPTNQSNHKDITGTVLRVGTMQFGDSVVMQLLLQGNEKVFNINPKDQIYAMFIREGDTVELEYTDTDEGSVLVDKVYDQTIGK